MKTVGSLRAEAHAFAVEVRFMTFLVSLGDLAERIEWALVQAFDHFIFEVDDLLALGFLACDPRVDHEQAESEHHESSFSDDLNHIVNST